MTPTGQQRNEDVLVRGEGVSSTMVVRGIQGGGIPAFGNFFITH